jgi:hypothetical protein
MLISTLVEDLCALLSEMDLVIECMNFSVTSDLIFGAKDDQTKSDAANSVTGKSAGKLGYGRPSSS